MIVYEQYEIDPTLNIWEAILYQLLWAKWYGNVLFPFDPYRLGLAESEFCALSALS